mmetsp:Transcript_2375/g.7652  ORF Transcript_2375/g.7652 Transcript_2375/m.7652 type:complete len:92 (+) Transcript_2375:199-474(+)
MLAALEHELSQLEPNHMCGFAYEGFKKTTAQRAYTGRRVADRPRTSHGCDGVGMRRTSSAAQLNVNHTHARRLLTPPSPTYPHAHRLSVQP